MKNLKENRKIRYIGSKEICTIYIKIEIFDEAHKLKFLQKKVVLWSTYACMLATEKRLGQQR